MLRPRGEKDHDLPTGQTEALLVEPNTGEEILTPQEGQSSINPLVRGHKESDSTEHTHTYTHLHARACTQVTVLICLY